MLDRPLYRNLFKELTKEKRMVFMAGARRVGKTTLGEMIAESFANHEYLSWEIPEHRARLIRERAPRQQRDVEALAGIPRVRGDVRHARRGREVGDLPLDGRRAVHQRVRRDRFEPLGVPRDEHQRSPLRCPAPDGRLRERGGRAEHGDAQARSRHRVTRCQKCDRMTGSRCRSSSSQRG